MKPLSLLPLLLVACSHPVKDGVGLEEEPAFGGANITQEMQSGQFFIGPGDLVHVDIWSFPDLSRSYVVDSDGSLDCHLIDPIPLGGQMTLSYLRNELFEAYNGLLVEPSIALTVTLSMLRKVTVLGTVNQPGVFPLDTPKISVLEIIALAGGIPAEGDTTGIILARQVGDKVEVRSYNLSLLFDPSLDDPPSQIPFVRPGDFVYVLRTDRAQYSDTLKVVTDTLRSITLSQMIIRNTPTVFDQLSGGS